jgi:hypothetical protein
VLFHKGDLTEASATDLSPAVREAIRHAQQRVVAVVLNALDDHLSKSDQLRLSWTLAQFQHLDALLYEAQLAHRIVVITSDYGQVLNEGMSRAMAGETERWRVFSGELVEGEAVFEGPRVERVTGFPCIIAAWSEVLRYSQKKHGYHGSATPQEVLVPIGVFVRSDGPTEGWKPASDRKRAWWSGPAHGSPCNPTSPAAASQSIGGATSQSLHRHRAKRHRASTGTGWIDHVLSSPIFAAQRRMAGRRALDNGTMAGFLTVLDQHYDSISQRVLAQALGQPDLRIRGMLVVLQRLLIVEGYQVVAIDEVTGSIELNRPLLAKQFQLPSCFQ